MHMILFDRFIAGVHVHVHNAVQPLIDSPLLSACIHTTPSLCKYSRPTLIVGALTKKKHMPAYSPIAIHTWESQHIEIQAP